MTAQEAHKFAAHKARYGHKCWIAWKDAAGNGFAELETPSSVKRAMLAIGTKGHWTAFNGTVGYIQRWNLGILRLRSFKYVH